MVNAVNEIDVTKLKCICRWYGFKSFARLRLLKIVDFIVVIVVTANFSLSRFRCQVIGRGDGLKAVSNRSQELWNVLRDFLRDIVQGKNTGTHLREASAALSIRLEIEAFVLVTRLLSIFDSISRVVQ